MSNLARILNPEQDAKIKSLERRVSFYSTTGVWIEREEDGATEKALMSYLMKMKGGAKV